MQIKNNLQAFNDQAIDYMINFIDPDQAKQRAQFVFSIAKLFVKITGLGYTIPEAEGEIILRVQNYNPKEFMKITNLENPSQTLNDKLIPFISD